MHYRFLLITICIVGLVAVLTASTAHGTCPFIKYTVLGRVLVPEDIESTAMKVYFFLEGARRTSDYPPAPGEFDFWPVATNGTFVVTSFYSTYDRRRSKGRKEESCERVAATGDLIIIGEGLHAERVSVDFPGTRAEIRRKMLAEADVGVIAVAPLEDLAEAPTPKGESNRR